MKNKKVLLVFGTRPEAIKMAPIVKVLEKTDDIDFKVCVSGQHKEMLEQVLQIFDITPDYDLKIMKKGQDLFDITAEILIKIKAVLLEYEPDVVLVHGDTSTAFASALAAFYKNIPVGHVEAGLRTYDLYAPYPEEANRQLIDRLAAFYFAPTYLNEKKLLNEGVSSEKILITGNTVIDALKIIDKKNSEFSDILEENISQLGYSVQKDRKFVLVTGHRRENFGDGFEHICEALYSIAIENKNIDIVYPVHLNPNVKTVVYDKLSNLDNIYLLNPLEYRPFVYLMKKAHIILTDSGGIQEEAPYFTKPVLVMRDVTEREEAVLAGTVKLVGTDSNRIIKNVSKLLTDDNFYRSFMHNSNPYGQGDASEMIVNYIKKKI